ncbi:SDR family oxidoreductase [Herbaspirillum frisingense]|uniref:SDR family oxidoreductase n=1 Tax=Herbaspirillum frisingense TaxID=92645 RepID=UPI0016004D7F|nr:SDR family oxidoreductase [Herbaspirillum frisingense]QNB06140.1 SDR family oxidoreductase [Herbaspirillum frisingense]
MKTFELLKPPPGLRVFISGAATGIGAAVAEAFLEAGAAVYVCDIDPVAIRAMQERHPGCFTGVADVAKAEEVEFAIGQALETLGGIDVLINNAGIAGPTASVEDIAVADWERTIDTNLNGQFYFLKHVVPILKKTSRDASIIAVSSVAGRLGYPYRTPYASTKWAIVGLMKSLAMELGPDNIRVNAILPGVVEGPRMDGVIAARAQAIGITADAMREEYLKKISLRRMVTVQDVAAMALFLSSPAARNLTGQAISVDGNVEYL